MLIEELIIRYLTGRLTGEEERWLQAWLEEDDVNRQVFENMVADAKLSRTGIERSKARIYRRVSGGFRAPQRVRRLVIYLSKVAAVLTLVCVTAWIIYLMGVGTEAATATTATIVKQALPGQKLKVRLPDGTYVMLNSGSRIVAPERFEDHERTVWLEGEAFFDVTRDAGHPFVIRTHNLDVRVLGTSFGVRSFAGEDSVSVSVLTGKVMISGKADDRPDNQQLLLPNERLAYSVKDKVFSEKKWFDHDEVLGWKDKVLAFRDVTIDNVLVTLSRWYGVEFDVQATLDHTREFTGSFRNPTLRQVLESISYSYQFEYEIKQGRVLLK